MFFKIFKVILTILLSMFSHSVRVSTYTYQSHGGCLSVD